MIFSDSLPYAKEFFAALNAPLSTTLTLLRFVTACFQRIRSAADAANAIRIDPRHRAQITRFLAREGWSRNWCTLNTLAQLLLQQCYAEQGTWIFILDQTYHTTYGKHAQNTFSRGNKKARSRSSARKQKQTHRHACHCFIFGLLISPRTGTRLPCARSYYTKDYCEQQAAQCRRHQNSLSYRSQTDLAAELIEQLVVPSGCPVLVLGDTAFEAKQIRAACQARGFDWITPANPERVLAGKKNRQRLRDYRTHLDKSTSEMVSLSPGLNDWWRHQRGSRCKAWLGKYARQYWTQGETLNVHNIGTIQVVFSSKRAPKEDEPSEVQKILLCNRVDWDASRVVSAYAVRWQIEQFFKEMKSDLGMSRYRVRCFREVEGWVQACCIAFVYLEWYRHRRRAESEEPEWWWRQRSSGLIVQIQREIEWLDLEQIVSAMETEEGQRQLRARLGCVVRNQRRSA